MAEKKLNTTIAPQAPIRDNSLYEQIAAGDEMLAQASRRQSWVMTLMVTYMRMTLSIDAMRREYQWLFHILAMVWAGVMSILYVGGITMFIILITSFIRFPDYVRAYLDENGIQYRSVEVPGYIISRVEIYDLHNKENTYNIDKVSVSSTFSDFLNRRAKNVSLNGVKIQVDREKAHAENPISVLSRLHLAAQLGGGIRVDSLEVSDATLTLKGENYEIPISFSLTGIYGRETNISAFVSVDEPSLNLRGPLSIRDSGKGIAWDLEIQSGSVVLPGRPRETLQGKLSLETQRAQIQSLGADLTLFYDRLKKHFVSSLELDKAAYKGHIDLTWTDMSLPNMPVDRTAISLDLTGLTFSNDGKIQTDKPVAVKLSTTYAADMQVQGLTGNLQGKLDCSLTGACSFDLNRQSSLSAQWMRVPTLGTTLNSTEKTRLIFTPTKDMLSLNLKEGHLKFDIPIKDINFVGTQFESSSSATFKVKSVRIAGDLSLWDKKLTASLSANGINYNTQSHEISDATLVMDDIFDDNARLYFKSPRVVLRNNDYLKVPFDLDMIRQRGKTDLTATIENKSIRLAFSGYWDGNSGTIDGQFVIPTISLDKVKKPYSRLSNLFPTELQSVSGKIAAYGRLNGSVYGVLRGPMYVVLSDVGIHSKTIGLNGINTALSVQSLKPFITDVTQEITIDRIDTIIPLKQVDIKLRLEDKFAQLTDLSAQVAGIPLYAEATIVPYKSVGTVLYLKNQATDLSNMANALSLNNWKIIPPIQGSISFPIEIKDLSLALKTITLQLTKASMNYTGKIENKPSSLDKNTYLEIQSGTISLDSDKNQPQKTKITLFLDTLLGKNKKNQTHHVIKETINTTLSDILTFKGNDVPSESGVKQQVETTLKQIEQLGL